MKSTESALVTTDNKQTFGGREEKKLGGIGEVH